MTSHMERAVIYESDVCNVLFVVFCCICMERVHLPRRKVINGGYHSRNWEQ